MNLGDKVEIRIRDNGPASRKSSNRKFLIRSLSPSRAGEGTGLVYL